MIVLDHYDIVYQLMDYETDESEDFMSCCDVNEHEGTDDADDFMSCCGSIEHEGYLYDRNESDACKDDESTEEV
jgi:hypothetical protein